MATSDRKVATHKIKLTSGDTFFTGAEVFSLYNLRSRIQSEQPISINSSVYLDGFQTNVIINWLHVTYLGEVTL